jgi:pyruvate formate lyase activating enzyme
MMEAVEVMEAARVAFRKTSLVDYPGKVASVIFFQGCNLRCPWCYNGELVLGTAQGLITLDEAFVHIEKRRLVLGGVVLSGGEPTLQKELGAIIQRLIALGLAVKLDTNGLLPDKLETILGSPKTRPQFIAMDVKTAPERYARLTPAFARLTPTADVRPQVVQNIAARVRKSAALIRESGIPYEFRSLELPHGYLSAEDWEAMRETAGGKLSVRAFHGGSCLDDAWNH